MPAAISAVAAGFRLRQGYGGQVRPARDLQRPLAARIFSISSITRFIDRIVRSSGSSVVMSTPASFSRSIGYFDPPALRNAR